MRPYGYSWNQSTITRIESASRPLRVNELADLAILFGIPASELLEPQVVLSDDTDLRALEAEIAKLEAEESRLDGELDAARHASFLASDRMNEVLGELARITASLEILRRWRPKASGDGESG